MSDPITRFKSPVRLDYVVRAGSVTAEFLQAWNQEGV